MPPAPLLFPPQPESRLPYRFAVPPPRNIEEGPLTLYGRKTRIQKRIIRAIDNQGRFSTCITIPKREAGAIDKELKYARKRGADFLLRTDISRFEASFKGRNSRVIYSYLLIVPPVAWDVNGKTWLGEGVLDMTVIDCSSGNQVYSSTVKAEALYNFSLNDEMNEMQMGKNYIRFILGGIVLNNLMVRLVDDLNENLPKLLGGHEEAGPEGAPAATPPLKDHPEQQEEPPPANDAAGRSAPTAPLPGSAPAPGPGP